MAAYQPSRFEVCNNLINLQSQIFFLFVPYRIIMKNLLRVLRAGLCNDKDAVPRLKGHI